MEYTSIIVEYIIFTLTKPVVVFIIIYLLFYYIEKKGMDASICLICQICGIIRYYS